MDDYEKEGVQQAFVDSGILVNSAQFSGLPSEDAQQAVKP